MKQLSFQHLTLHNIGNSIQLIGAIYQGDGQTFLMPFPGENVEKHEKSALLLTLENWKDFLRQTDIVEREILEHGPQGITKAIIRKTQRKIEGNVMWAVYRRDKYSCRYCGKTGVPLSVDHLILWEDGGPSTQENLVSACKPCNRTRGSVQYEDWINSEEYAKISASLPFEVREANIELIEKIKLINNVEHKRSR